ncbi:MAG: hypothetical protein JO336_13785 [Acidobacteriia bacterium]|nr:hypothetical protein [Terriglobia bacterium]MBV8903089.1 hypothetical protein [Terriglobia bacterium]MBV9744029.1 hypothetical protein [Terriglobia bacterium]
MKNPLVVSFGIAVLIVIGAIAGFFFFQRGAHLELRGQVLKVRTAALDENHSVAVVDFRFLNLADYEYNVHKVTVIVDDKSGMTLEGMTISELDAQHLFEGIPLLGQKYNPSLIVRNRIPPHATEDRMIAASFPVPAAQLEMRRGLTVSVEEAEGVVSEIKEK